MAIYTKRIQIMAEPSLVKVLREQAALEGVPASVLARRLLRAALVKMARAR